MYGLRWAPRGVPALYLADSAALAMLETLVRAQPRGYSSKCVGIDEIRFHKVPSLPMK